MLGDFADVVPSVLGVLFGAVWVTVMADSPMSPGMRIMSAVAVYGVLFIAVSAVAGEIVDAHRE